MSLLDMDAILAQTAKAVAQMNQPAAPGEATREYYREQGRQQERERIIKRFEACLCFEKYACEDKRCIDIMAFIAIVKGETNDRN